MNREKDREKIASIAREIQLKGISAGRKPLDEVSVKGTVRKARGGGGGTRSSNRLMGSCRWMGSHFYDWVDYKGVAFSIEVTKMGLLIFGTLGERIFR